MLPEAPKAGKRIFLEHIRPIWKHLSFTQKVTARNLFRYKKRLIMTIIGIGGCTALLVTGFGLHDSVSGILEKQYGQIYRYGVLAGFEKVENADEIKEAMHEYLPDTEWMLQMTKQGEIRHEGHSADINLYVPEQTEGFADFVDLRTRRGQKRIPFTEDSVVVSEKLAEKLGVSVGSTIEWKNEKGHYVPLTVTGICEQYVYDYVYFKYSYGKEIKNLNN